MTALQGLEALGGTTTLGKSVAPVCERYATTLRGPPAVRGTPGVKREAVRLSHQKAVKAGSVVHFVSA